MLLAPRIAFTQQLPCDEELAIDISEGQLLPDSSMDFDGVRYSPRDYGVRNGTTFGCLCGLRTCLRKCCPLGQYLFDKVCVESARTFSSVGVSDDSHLIAGYSIISGNSCHGKPRLLLDPREENQRFHLKEDGRLEVPSHREEYGLLDFCVDYIQEEDVAKALVCAVDGHSAAQYYWIGT